MEYKEIGYDESFKILAKIVFQDIGNVFTDFEILKLPKKTDVLVIETTKPLKDHLKIFDYFKKINIIEFKSVDDPFVIEKHYGNILSYVGGTFNSMDNKEILNYTFSLVCSRKPKKLLSKYQSSVQIDKNGVYLIKGILEIPVYVVVANEVQGKLDKEMALIKEFSTGDERVKYLSEILHRVVSGDPLLHEFFHYALSLYKQLLLKIAQEEQIDMSIVEKNVREWNKELGLEDEYKKKFEQEANFKTALKMLKDGMDIELISKYTGLTKDQIIKSIKKRHNT